MKWGVTLLQVITYQLQHYHTAHGHSSTLLMQTNLISGILLQRSNSHSPQLDVVVLYAH
jgi:hypothetical protein